MDQFGYEPDCGTGAILFNDDLLAINQGYLYFGEHINLIYQWRFSELIYQSLTGFFIPVYKKTINFWIHGSWAL